MGFPPFPARTATVIDWRSISNPGATFGNYVNYMEKKPASPRTNILLGIPHPLRTLPKAPSLRGRVVVGGFRFPNFPESPPDKNLKTRTIYVGVPPNTIPLPLSHPALPFGCARLAKSFQAGYLTRTPQAERALIVGVRGNPCDQSLVVRFRQRKNIPNVALRPARSFVSFPIRKFTSSARYTTFGP